MWLFTGRACCCGNENEDAKQVEFNKAGDERVDDCVYEPPMSPATGRGPMDGNDSAMKMISMVPKLTSLKAYWHKSERGLGEKTPQYEKTRQFTTRYYAALNKAFSDNWTSWLDLWADDSEGIYMEDSAGAMPMRKRTQIEEFVKSFPPMSVDAKLVRISQDELQGAGLSVFHMRGFLAGKDVECIETFQVNTTGKLVYLKLYWHPSEIGGVQKTMQHDVTEKAIRKFVEALNKTSQQKDKVRWCDESGGVEFDNPVGAPARLSEDTVARFISSQPSFVAKAKVVRIAQDELQGAAAVDFSSPTSEAMPSAMIFVFAFA